MDSNSELLKVVMLVALMDLKWVYKKVELKVKTAADESEN